MQITEKELFATFTPLLVALHEKKILDIAEVAHMYEDALHRRLQLNESPEDLAFQQHLVSGLHRLSAAVKSQEQSRPT